MGAVDVNTVPCALPTLWLSNATAAIATSAMITARGKPLEFGIGVFLSVSVESEYLPDFIRSSFIGQSLPVLFLEREKRATFDLSALLRHIWFF
jgi:hypothetical protein